jgi:hypothetical protein
MLVQSTSIQICRLTYSMEKSPSWEANWFAASQEFPPVLWNPKVPHRTHKRPPRISILSQHNPVLTPTSHFLKIHHNIILPSTDGSPQRSLYLRFPHQNPVHTSPFTPYVLHSPPISLFSILSPARYWVRSTDHQNFPSTQLKTGLCSLDDRMDWWMAVVGTQILTNFKMSTLHVGAVYKHSNM